MDGLVEQFLDQKSRELRERKSAPAKPVVKKNISALTPSAEQKVIIDDCVADRKICIAAVAGAGKSTTLLMCGAARPGKKCLMLTYNKGLQLDVAARIAEYGLKNMTVRTYHSAASAAYGCIISNDTRFIAAIRSAPPNPPKFDILMLDEVQDMTIEYYVFVRHLLATNPNAQWIVVGDPRQAIYQYKGSRVEFLTDCDEHFGGFKMAVAIAAAPDAKTAAPDAKTATTDSAPKVPGGVTSVRSLLTTYRLTPATAAFVNVHVLQSDILVGGNTKDADVAPLYVPTGFKNAAARMRDTVLAAIKEYGPTNVALIAPSVKSVRRGDSSNPLAELVRVHLAKIPTFVATRDDEVATDAETAGKFVIGTFNSMKGRERDCVIVAGLDELYFKYNAQDWEIERPDVPNILYVAATRARKRLIVIASAKDTLRTVDLERLRFDAEVVATKDKLALKRSAGAPEREQWLSVSDLLQHAPSELLFELRKLITVVGSRTVKRVASSAPYQVSFAAGVTDAKKASVKKEPAQAYSESVGMLYGIVGPALAELVKTRKSKFGAECHKPVIVKTEKEMFGRFNCFTQQVLTSYPADFWPAVAEAYATSPTARPIADWMRLAVAQNAFDSGAHHVARQIRHYDWVNTKHLKDIALAICETLKETSGSFEIPLPTFRHGSKTIHGRADFVELDVDAKEPPKGVFKTPNSIWEFKCSLEVQEKHLLQLACYLALAGAAVAAGTSTGHDDPIIGHCYAVLSGEIVSIVVADSAAFLRLALSKYYPPKGVAPIHEAILAFERQHLQGGATGASVYEMAGALPDESVDSFYDS